MLYDKKGEEKVMRNVIFKILVICLKILYTPMRLLKPKDRVALISREGNKEPMEFKKIRKEIENNYPEYKVKVISKK